MDSLPKISIITPSYNQGQYIEQTILSVIYQGYDNIEYIVMDGGSKDETVDIIKKYEKYIKYWRSEKDNGQTAALNEGFAMATGDILYWLCSDDVLLPGTLIKIGNLFKSVTEPTIHFGNCIHFRQSKLRVRSSDVINDREKYTLSLCNYMMQPSAFWNRSAWELTGVLNEDLYYSMDWDWFIRAQKAGVKFIAMSDYLSLFRWHEGHKTSVKGKNNPRDVELGVLHGIYNGEKIKKAWTKIRKLRNNNKFIHNVIYASYLYKLTFLSRILHLLICPSINYYEYDNITRM